MHLLKNCNKSLMEVYLQKGKNRKRHFGLHFPKKNQVPLSELEMKGAVGIYYTFLVRLSKRLIAV
jgi:hypothetical protein